MRRGVKGAVCSSPPPLTATRRRGYRARFTHLAVLGQQRAGADKRGGPAKREPVRIQSAQKLPV